MKRTFVVGLSGTGLLIASPVCLLFAAAIKLQDGGPDDWRIGQGDDHIRAGDA